MDHNNNNKRNGAAAVHSREQEVAAAAAAYKMTALCDTGPPSMGVLLRRRPRPWSSCR